MGILGAFLNFKYLLVMPDFPDSFIYLFFFGGVGGGVPSRCCTGIIPNS